jgi:hypothetical protein
MAYESNEVVNKIGEIAMEGNVIPNEWYIQLRNEKGKIQTNAALILADIVCWYRPIPIHDMQTGKLIGHGKKFKDNLLQLSYKYFSHKFGFSAGQSRNALIFLEEKGLIFREFREIKMGEHTINNVMHIGIYPEKISEICGQTDHRSTSPFNKAIEQPIEQIATQTKASAPSKPKGGERDWSAKFSVEQKHFLDYLLNIKPEIGDVIEKDHATWWIKHFGIDKVKMALQVYWQQVEKAKQDSTIPVPQHIGRYVRKALNDGIIPLSTATTPCSKKSQQVGGKIEMGSQKNETTNTHISMKSMNINEVNDQRASMTFRKEKDFHNKTPSHAIANEIQFVKSHKKTSSIHHASKNATQQQNWASSFSSEEKKFLAFLLKLQPDKGDRIEEKHATWWIKSFGIEKIKIALQVYWQQVEKAKKNSKIPMPESIGAYVREALNKGIQPCREVDVKNKAFAEHFKKQVGWGNLIFTEKYCRAEEIGKEWYYNLPETLFQESLQTTFENCFSFAARKSCTA